LDGKLKKCFDNGLLTRIEPSPLKARKSIETSEKHLLEAKALEKAGFNEQAVAWAYASLFHACRALLYKDGVQEKSHYCLAEYVAQEYAAKGLVEWSLVTALNSFREERHAIFYGVEGAGVEKHEAKQAIETSGRMLEHAKKLLEKS
jgi:uncharacterized protein (UPF0332 family)